MHLNPHYFLTSANCQVHFLFSLLEFQNWVSSGYIIIGMNYHFTNFCIEISTWRQVEAFNFPKIKLSSFENNIEKIKVEKVLYLNENVRDQDGYQDFQDPN